MPNFAANLTGLFPEYPALERFAAAKRAGFPAVEMLAPYDLDPDALKETLAHNQLRFVLINLPGGGETYKNMGVACCPGLDDAFHDSFAEGLAFAREFAVERIHVQAGYLPEGCDRQAAYQQLLKSIRHALSQLREGDPGLSIEPINDIDNPGFFMTTSDQILALLDDLDDERIGLQFDLYHAAVMGEDIGAVLNNHLDRICHIQVSGLPGRHEPDSSQEIDFPHYFDQLDLLGYQGWTACEYRPRNESFAGLAQWGRPYGLGLPIS